MCPFPTTAHGRLSSQRRLTADYARGSLTMPAKRVILTVLSKIVKTKGRLRLKLMNWPGPLRVATRPVAAEATVPCSSTRTLAWGGKGGLVFRYSLGILGILYLGILYLGILYLGILYLGILYLVILYLVILYLVILYLGILYLYMRAIYGTLGSILISILEGIIKKFAMSVATMSR